MNIRKPCNHQSVARLVFFVALIFLSSSLTAATRAIKSTEWPQAPTASAMLTLPSMVQTMEELHNTPNSYLHVYHADSDAGVSWARDLRDYLVALGVSSEHIVLAPQASAQQHNALFLQVLRGARDQ